MGTSTLLAEHEPQNSAGLCLGQNLLANRAAEYFLAAVSKTDQLSDCAGDRVRTQPIQENERAPVQFRQSGRIDVGGGRGPAGTSR